MIPLSQEAEHANRADVRAQARRWVYDRLALLSAVIWVLGTFALVVTIVPDDPRPQRYFVIAMTVPLVPAALPWLFYRWLSDVRARRLLRDAHGSD